MKKLITLILLLLCSQAFAEISIKERLEAKQIFRDIYPLIHEPKDIAWTPRFREVVQELKKDRREEVLEFVKDLDSTVPAPILRALAYYRFIKVDAQAFEKVLSFYMNYKLLMLRDYLDSPESLHKDRALELLSELLGAKSVASHQILSKAKEDLKIKAQMIAKLEDRYLTRALKEVRLIADNFKRQLPDLTPYVLSDYGLVGGNRIEVISENQTDIERIEWVNERVIFAGGKIDWNAPYIQMPMPGDSLDKGNVIFHDPIFARIRDMVLEAKESLFIDIFLFGGTMGMTLTKFVVEQTLIKKKTNPNFKTLIIHDYATNYNMKDEMMPIFEYLKSRIEKEKDVRESVMLMQANIQRHPPGIPLGLTNLIPKTPEVFKEIEGRNTYYESKIDHSKVVVIDANTDSPKAYFGSKNWSDHSGAYYYDDAIYVEGPAAALVQASYYHDLEAALTTEPTEQKWFYFKELGFDNKRYLDKRDSILKWFKIKRETYPSRGTDLVRIAEADVDGVIKNVRNILIDMIMKAQDHIYMEQLFFYDPYVVDALIKKKIQTPELQVKILADHNGNFHLGGFPNTIFLSDLTKYGIEVRARRTVGVMANFPDGTSREYHQENHRKITSVDGKVLLGGSSNINPDTLQGSFREFGAQVYAPLQVQAFEERFLAAWDDPKQTMLLNVKDFQLTLKGETLSKSLSRLINGIAATLFRNKDALEERHK